VNHGKHSLKEAEESGVTQRRIRLCKSLLRMVSEKLLHLKSISGNKVVE
jgi:hypothetical protein